MGDRSKLQLYTMLLDFPGQHGHSLQSEGCAERGLSSENALEFIQLLESHSVALLGFDIWRRVGNRYRVDVSEIWYAPTPQVAGSYKDARSSLLRATLGPEDLVAIQFK